MKLDKNVVQRRVDLLEAEGVQFVTDTEIGKDIRRSNCNLNDYDAVVLCGGATKPRELNTEGASDLKGVDYAMDFLNGSIKSYLDSNLEEWQLSFHRTRMLSYCWRRYRF